VVDAGARSLKMIYHSKLAPKYDFLQEKNLEFLLSLLNSENENVTELGASIITHFCETSIEQRALTDAGVLKELVCLLGGSLCQIHASLESLATIIKGNPEVILKLLGFESGRGLSAITELTRDRYPGTRLLACMCLIAINITSPCYLQVFFLIGKENIILLIKKKYKKRLGTNASKIKNTSQLRTKTKLMLILLELLDDPGEVGDEAAFALSSLIAEKEHLQKLALEANVVLNLVTDAVTHDSAIVCAAACVCLKSVSRSVKNLSAGSFMNEVIVIRVQLLHDSSTSAQVAALGAISNIVVDFTTQVFIQHGGVKQLVDLSKSMDSTIRVNAVWALRNLLFLTDNRCKGWILLVLTASTLTSLIDDPEPSVQEQALALVCNLVDGSIGSMQYVFVEDGLILHAVGRQLQTALKPEVLIQVIEAIHEQRLKLKFCGVLKMIKKAESDYAHGNKSQRETMGSGFVIPGQRILTNAHVVADHTFVLVRKHGSPNKNRAEVQAIGHECDLAILTVNSKEFWEGMNSLELGDIPFLQEAVAVVGYPQGGDNISVTKGVVSRVEPTQYVHGATQLMAIQIDAAINPGNSGGPAIMGNNHGEQGCWGSFSKPFRCREHWLYNTCPCHKTFYSWRGRKW
ncbi:hypothetical protein LOK49_LG10G01350, partial [Camellia lanceoleosa]